MRKKTNLFLLMAFAAVIIAVSCDKEGKDDKEITYPTVTTAEVTDIIQSSAKCGGEVTFDGNTAVKRGICWSATENPTIEDNHTDDGLGEGVFESQITGLAPNVKYYVRAYATNSMGTSYGNEREFTTPL